MPGAIRYTLVSLRDLALSAGPLALLEQLEERVGKVSVPLSYVDELYALRNNIGTVRRKLDRA